MHRAHVHVVLQFLFTKPSALIQHNPKICPRCFSESLVIHHVEGATHCTSCGNSVDNYEAIPGFSETYGPYLSTGTRHVVLPRELSASVQKRCNHFKFWLKRLQGTENLHIDPEKRDRIHLYVTRQFGDLSNLTYRDMQNALRDLGLCELYPHIYFLISEVRQAPYVVLEKDHVTELVRLFRSLQDSFLRHAKGRSNMLSYPYVIRKLVQIKEWDDLYEALPSFKSSIKAYQADLIWKKICEDQGWPFYSSV